LFGLEEWDKLQDAAVRQKQKGHVQVGGDHAGSSQDDKRPDRFSGDGHGAAERIK